MIDTMLTATILMLLYLQTNEWKLANLAHAILVCAINEI